MNMLVLADIRTKQHYGIQKTEQNYGHHPQQNTETMILNAVRSKHLK